MKRVRAIVFGAMATVVLTGGAHAQPARSVAPSFEAQTQAEVPWYERFTSPSSSRQVGSGLGPLAPATEPASVAALGRWGFSVSGHLEAPQLVVTGPVVDESSVTAYFKVSPRFQLNGRLSVGEAQNQLTGKRVESSSAVKIESVFKF